MNERAAPEQVSNDPIRSMEPVQAGREPSSEGVWTLRLVWFLRGMAVLSMLKGLFHWSIVLGIGDGDDNNFTLHRCPGKRRRSISR